MYSAEEFVQVKNNDKLSQCVFLKTMISLSLSKFKCRTAFNKCLSKRAHPKEPQQEIQISQTKENKTNHKT